MTETLKCYDLDLGLDQTAVYTSKGCKAHGHIKLAYETFNNLIIAMKAIVMQHFRNNSIKFMFNILGIHISRKICYITHKSIQNSDS